MKRVLLCLFAFIVITDSFANGIGANNATAPCDSATLSKYNGTADIEINWEPNTIGLKWYNGDQQIEGQTSCVYDGMITVPPQPTKPGYTFNGWKIPKMDFSTIPTTQDGLERWAKASNGICWYDNAGFASIVACESDTVFGELQRNEWKVKFEHGTIYGVSECSLTSGTWAQSGNPVNGSGNFCWCKATGYAPGNSNLIYGSLYSLYWVFHQEVIEGGNCETVCTPRCANQVEYQILFRKALYIAVQ